MKLGIYRMDDLLDEERLDCLERDIGAPVEVLSFYRAWNRCDIEDDLPWLDRLAASRKEILLTWEPWRIPADRTDPQLQPDFSLRQILSGRYERYIRAFARALQRFTTRVYLRPIHEMNGNWYPWCGTVNGNKPGEFVPAWNYLRQIFKEEGTAAPEWVWSPYAASFPPTAENRIETYFPGDGQIDWAALDGYNWGSKREWGSWQSFEEIFSDGYDLLTGISRKPLMIAETGCAETGGEKGSWIRDAFDALGGRFPRVGMLVWFDVDKECDWRIVSSPASLLAFREVAGLRSA